MEKEDIINYVMETPGNSNPAVLGSMLNLYDGGSGQSADFLIVSLTMNEDDDFIGDKTASELNSAITNEKPIIFIFKSDFWKQIWWGTNYQAGDDYNPSIINAISAYYDGSPGQGMFQQSILYCVLNLEDNIVQYTVIDDDSSTPTPTPTQEFLVVHGTPDYSGEGGYQLDKDVMEIYSAYEENHIPVIFDLRGYGYAYPDNISFTGSELTKTGFSFSQNKLWINNSKLYGMYNSYSVSDNGNLRFQSQRYNIAYTTD